MSKEKLPISAVMVIYNEEKVLERSLKSFYDIVDEIIIVHDGKCTDNSLKIAQKYTNNIFERERVGASEKHRPLAYEKARNNWILQLDADEYLSVDLKNNLKNMILGEADIYEASYTIYLDYYLFHKRILFKKNKVYLIGVPHECVMPIDNMTKISQVKYKIMHEFPISKYSIMNFRKRWGSCVMAHAKSLLEDFQRIPKWNCDLTEWETRRKLLIKYPILLGVIGATFYKVINSIKLLLKFRKLFLIRMGIYSCMYSFYLYYQVYILKKSKNARSDI